MGVVWLFWFCELYAVWCGWGDLFFVDDRDEVWVLYGLGCLGEMVLESGGVVFFTVYGFVAGEAPECFIN